VRGGRENTIQRSTGRKKGWNGNIGNEEINT
jgi:hypothetical protein